MQKKTALVVGATSVVGRELVRQLAEHPDYGKVILWLRREWPQPHPKIDARVIDFDRIDSMPPEGVDEIYCALDTTIKQAGSRKRFWQVDVAYPTAVGHWGKAAGAKRFLLVSAPNAHPDSRIFYLRAKGAAEQALRALNYLALDIFHPPLIAGERADKRGGERLAIALFNYLPKNWLIAWRPMTGAQIATAMIAAAQQATNGVRIHRLRAQQF